MAKAQTGYFPMTDARGNPVVMADGRPRMKLVMRCVRDNSIREFPDDGVSPDGFPGQARQQIERNLDKRTENDEPVYFLDEKVDLRAIGLKNIPVRTPAIEAELQDLVATREAEETKSKIEIYARKAEIAKASAAMDQMRADNALGAAKPVRRARKEASDDQAE